MVVAKVAAASSGRVARARPGKKAETPKTIGTILRIYFLNYLTLWTGVWISLRFLRFLMPWIVFRCCIRYPSLWDDGGRPAIVWTDEGL